MTFVEKNGFRLAVFLCAYILFLCMGATLFLAIEEPYELQEAQEYRKFIAEFLEAHPCLPYHSYEQLVTKIIKVTKKRGVMATKNVTHDMNWSLVESLFFATTIVTTIGYGHVTPISRSGKIFCIMYTVVGITLTLVLLSALVERLLIPTLALLKWMNIRFGHSYRPLEIRIFHLIIMLIILLVFVLLIPAAIFDYLESEWNFLDCFYYCFVSLTTVGLGDFIPGDTYYGPYRLYYRLITGLYLFAGVTYMMLTLAVFYDIPQLNLGLLFTPSYVDENDVEIQLSTTGNYGYNVSERSSIKDGGGLFTAFSRRNSSSIEIQSMAEN